MRFRQARFEEPLIFELSRPGAHGFEFPKLEPELERSLEEALNEIPEELRREDLDLPELSELDVVRHFTRLSEMNYSITTGMYPLGSCTMKYNPVLNEEVASSPKVLDIHPLQPEETVQGCLKLLYDLEQLLKRLTGMDRFSFQPSAGAHGEFLGCLIIREYHRSKGRDRRV